MMSAADRIVEATMPYTLRPKRNEREKVIAAALWFVIEEYSYTPLMSVPSGYEGGEVIDVKDIRNLIEELRNTETLEELSHGITQHPRDAL